jgi:hypothetical protein
MTTAAFPATVRDSLTYQDALLDVVARARNGDAAALAYVFYGVYHEVFLSTRDRHAAERATRRALDRLPSMLRSHRYVTVAKLRDSLVTQAQHNTRKPRHSAVPVGRMRNLRAGVRHLVLVSAAAIAAVGALILAI